MTWAFSASGPKGQCASAIEAAAPPEDPANAAQFKLAMNVLKQELDRYEDGSSGMSIAASGHAPGVGGGDRSFSIWISGKAAAHAEPAKGAAKSAPSAETAEPPLTTRRR